MNTEAKGKLFDLTLVLDLQPELFKIKDPHTQLKHSAWDSSSKTFQDHL